VQYCPEVRQWFQRWKRKKPVRVARTLVAKELAQAVYVVLREGVDFNPQFKGTSLTTRKQASWPRRASPSVSLSARYSRAAPPCEAADPVLEFGRHACEGREGYRWTAPQSR